MTPHQLKNLAIVTTRFWPISGMSQIVAGDLATGLLQLGHQVEIFTQRWESRWAKSFSYREVPVTRTPLPSNGPWGSFRTYRALARSLSAGNFDAVIVFGIDESFETTIKTLAKTSTKVIVRLDDSVTPAQLLPQNLTRKSLNLLEQANSIICTSTNLRQRLIAAGIQNQNVVVIPDGALVSDESPRTQNGKSASRMALCDAHPILAIEPDAPLAITGVPMQGDAGIYDLIRAWKRVIKTHPNGRLWIIGEGDQSRKVWNQITTANLVYSAIMPGFFDCLEDLFQAADVYLHPSRDEVGQTFLIRAMASGLCPVTTDDLDGLIREGVNGKVVPRQDPPAMKEAMLQLLGDESLNNELGYAAKIAVKGSLTQETMLQRYIELIHDSSHSCEPI